MGKRFSPDHFALFWTLQPSQIDLNNLDICKAKRVELTYTLARDHPEVLDLLRGLGKDVVLRSTPADMATGAHRAQVLATVAQLARRANIVAFIGWNEVEEGVNWLFENADGSPADWQEARARQHAAEVSAFADAWTAQNTGVQLVAPPWSVHAIGEDDAPQPGMQKWSDITRYAYVKCRGGRGIHWYAWRWDLAGTVECNGKRQGGVNINLPRLKLRAQFDATLSHQLLWVDEVGIKDKRWPQFDKMAGYCEIAGWLLSPGQQKPGYMGTRVVHFSPFLSNGSQEWRDAGYMLDRPEAYEYLAQKLKEWRAR